MAWKKAKNIKEGEYLASHGKFYEIVQINRSLDQVDLKLFNLMDASISWYSCPGEKKFEVHKGLR